MLKIFLDSEKPSFFSVSDKNALKLKLKQSFMKEQLLIER